MANVSVKPAATGNYRHSYNPITVGSIDFGDLVSSRKIEVEKGDEWKKVHCKGTLRLLPQVFPAYGKNTLKSAAFFVPSSQLLESYDQFRNNKSLWKGKIVYLPYFYAGDINKMFYEHRQGSGEAVILCTVQEYGTDLSTCITNAEGAYKKWHFVYFVQSTGTWYLLSLNQAGKKLYKVFKMLGYQFASYKFTGDWTDYAALAATVQWKVDALDLLAYLKVYCDYFMNAHMYNTSPMVAWLQHIHDSETFQTNTFSVTSGYINSTTLFNALMAVLVPFEHNMYLDAFNSPNSPLGVDPSQEMISLNPDGVLSPISPLITSPNNSQFVGANKLISTKEDTSLFEEFTVSSQGASAIQTLSQLGINTLGALYQFVKRNNLFGSKPIQELFARFGIKSSDWNTHFAHKLYEGESEIDYSAVLSQTDSFNRQTLTGKSLGAFAGFGVSGLNFSFSYKASDHGYLLVLHWIQITPILIHGYDPSVLRVHPFDFYTPEYDGKTIRAIPYCEVSDNKRPLSTYGDTNVYGFTDIYDDYRNMKDNVFGDFVTDDDGANNFFFGRDLSFWRSGLRADTHDHSNPGTNGIIKPQIGYIQYMTRFGLNFDCTDPFQSSAANGDRFYLEMKFDVEASRHISSKSNALDLNGEGDQQMELGGTQIQ